ncbi:MAG: 23S rRNA (pseudouridine(1915)-N(3))-methyltransferase RlmH [Woeseiaceae bacterium]|nr:23S rRNA (pseudouridine(1915)-N(3))-methyltransferase RlmH [Woeseiaceae bacterium]
MRLIAVGDRQPAWVDRAFADYAGRLPRAWKFDCATLATSRRRKHGDISGALAEEGERILGRIRAAERTVVLDERGIEMTSIGLAAAVRDWQADGRDVCLVIGGPDGVADACLKRADLRWSLSQLTLPHGLARVLCAEQLYRACTLNDGHPYHRA